MRALGSDHICADIRRHHTAGTGEVLVARRRASRGRMDMRLDDNDRAV